MKKFQTVTNLPKMECPKCKHVWTLRVIKPEKCLNCGLRLNPVVRGEN